MTYPKFLISIILLLASSFAFSQLDGEDQKEKWDEDNVYLDGIVTDYYTGKSISGVKITATVDGKVVTSGVSDGKGAYKTVLEYDKVYTITFSKAGMTSKMITMNTSGVPDLKRQKVPDMIAEITLFKPNDCIKTDILNQPIGRAVYFTNKNVMDWDMEYSMPRLEKLNKMLDKCAKQAEEEAKREAEKEKQYNELMKTADKAFTKEGYEDALASYKAASALYPEKPEPLNQIKLIETEIAKKAEAEKQRAEEKERAAAELLAKAQAEAAAKKEEEERLAKEKAEAEAAAKAQAEAEEKAKAEAAALLAEQEKAAKEKAAAEAKAQKEAEEKARLKAEEEAKKLAEAAAKKEEAAALAQMEKEKTAKEKAEAEAKARAEAEAKALADKIAAKKREAAEKEAKEKAAALAQKAEDERAVNAKVMVEVKAEVQVKVDQREAQEKLNATIVVEDDEPKKDDIDGDATIKFKKKNKGRHLYKKPNKHRKGKGPVAKKRIVF